MKRIGLKTALLAILACMGPAMAWDGASVRNCTWCHGTSAQGYTVAPRLAGQRPAYLESQMRSFRDHSRDNPFSKQYMWGAVAALDSRDARNLAAYFATIPPRPANDGDRNLMAKGKAIYMEGIPEANIASCYACHGPNAEGVREIPASAALPISMSRHGSSSGAKDIIRAWERPCLSLRAPSARTRSRPWPRISASSDSRQSRQQFWTSACPLGAAGCIADGPFRSQAAVMPSIFCEQIFSARLSATPPRESSSNARSARSADSFRARCGGGRPRC